jgi:hypothetical protein
MHLPFAKSSMRTTAEWLAGAIMGKPWHLVREVALGFCQSRRLQLANETLGFGVQGTVFVAVSPSGPRSALKIHEFEDGYLRERDAYLRLWNFGVERILGHNVPVLLDFDDDMLAIQLTIVSRPFVLDFGGAYLDQCPEFDDTTMDEWRREKAEQFGENWEHASSIVAEFRRYGLYISDVHPGNIGFSV